MMKQNIATTPEQSRRLLACGVDPKSADFVWMDDNPPRLTLRTEIIEDNNPYIVAFAWSLSALLDMLPKEIADDNGDSYYFSLAKEMANSDDYNVAYKPCWFEDEDLVAKQSPSPIEACVKAVEWLTQQGYKLNEIK